MEREQKVHDTHDSSHQWRAIKRPPAETIIWAVNTLEAAVGCAFGDWRSEPSADGMVAIQGVFTAITTMWRAAVSQLIVRAAN